LGVLPNKKEEIEIIGSLLCAACFRESGESRLNFCRVHFWLLGGVLYHQKAKSELYKSLAFATRLRAESAAWRLDFRI